MEKAVFLELLVGCEAHQKKSYQATKLKFVARTGSLVDEKGMNYLLAYHQHACRLVEI